MFLLRYESKSLLILCAISNSTRAKNIDKRNRHSLVREDVRVQLQKKKSVVVSLKELGAKMKLFAENRQ
jgi:hypothetical protein